MSTSSIFVFMAGDNNLDSSGEKDTREMCESDLAHEVNVIIQFDRRKAHFWENPGNLTTKRFKVENHKLVEKQDVGETNTGDPEVLNEFLKWGISNFPAQRTMVILWNHGGGVIDTDIYKSMTGKAGRSLFVPEEQRRLRPVRKIPGKAVTVHLHKTEEPQDFPQKMICTDDTSRDFLDNLELKTALFLPRQKFDILAFDACLMNMFEIMYQVKDITGIVIGSEESEPAAGWPYQPILNFLSKNPSVDNNELAQEIVKYYLESYAATKDDITQSAIRTDSLENTARGLDDFAGLLAESLGSIKPELTDILSSVQRFSERDYLDLYDFVVHCQKNIAQKSITDSAASLLELLDQNIIANTTRGEKVKNAHGLSIYFPLEKPKEDVLEIYRRLDFTVGYPNWLRLVIAFHTPKKVQR